MNAALPQKGFRDHQWAATLRVETSSIVKEKQIMPSNFALLDLALPDVARLVTAMLQARDAVERRSWSHPQEPTGEEWWADVLADPRARKRERRTDLAVKQPFYRLADEKREIILVACAGRVFARRPHRIAWCGLLDAQLAQPSRRAGL